MTTRALILAPTRELAVQIEEVRRNLRRRQAHHPPRPWRPSRNAQIQAIARGVDVVIATPGRLNDLMDDRKIKLDETRWLVLDEADRMLDMGFIPRCRIVAALGPRRQTALFSATMPPEVAELAKASSTTRCASRSRRRRRPSTASSSGRCDGDRGKRKRLAELLTEAEVKRVIVFARTKHGADRVTKNLEMDGIAAEAIHGNKAQNARQRALKGFRNGQVRVLVATDIAARGIDVPNISHVINYDLPDEPENYVHRIGRTARNGASGTAITLCAPDELKKLRDVERLIRNTLLAPTDADREPRARPAGKPSHAKRGHGGAQGKPAHAGAPHAKPAHGSPQHVERARNRRPRRTQRAA